MTHPLDRLVAFALGGGLPKALFHVGEDRERSLLNTDNKLYSNQLQSTRRWSLNNESILLESVDALRSPADLPGLVVNGIDGG